MRTKLVLWGTNANDEKVLITLELKAKENKVEVRTFPESIATDEFFTILKTKWSDTETFEFPEGGTFISRELTLTDSILPDDLKTERTDLINVKQTEWHFVVLSAKLHESYRSEISEIEEKVNEITGHSAELWDSLKGFWSKVTEQVKEKNLFREHAEELKEKTNVLFDTLKERKGEIEKEFESTSQSLFDKLSVALDDVEKSVNEGLKKFPSLFEELKNVQKEFTGSKMTRDHSNNIWTRLDTMFKGLKEQRFGSDNFSPTDRITKRYEGLLNALDSMQESIRRDKIELDDQNKRINSSNTGQLEAQIRQARINMINERINSKQFKIDDMLKIKAELEAKLEQIKQNEAKKATAKTETKVEEVAKDTPVVAPITESKTEEVMAEVAKEAKPKKAKTEKVAEANTDTMTEVVDTIDAVADATPEV
jgi:hypothetical protein